MTPWARRRAVLPKYPHCSLRDNRVRLFICLHVCIHMHIHRYIHTGIHASLTCALCGDTVAFCDCYKRASIDRDLAWDVPWAVVDVCDWHHECTHTTSLPGLNFAHATLRQTLAHATFKISNIVPQDFDRTEKNSDKDSHKHGYKVEMLQNSELFLGVAS